MSASIRFLTAADVRTALSMPRAIDAMREAFRGLAERRAEMPARVSVSAGAGESVMLLMGAAVDGEGALGAKLVSVFPGNARRGRATVQAIALVLDWETGRPLGVLEGAALTALRTGAASGLATDLMARPDARVATVIGAGTQARTQLEAVCSVRGIERAIVHSRTPERARVLADELAGHGGIPPAIEVAAGAAEAVADADIVCVATTAQRPVLIREQIRPGTHINAVGSFRPDMIEIDPELVGAARVVVDQRAAALAEAGEVIAALEAGLLREDRLIELGAVVTGRSPGREDPEEITLFKSVGLAVQDVCAARRALETAAAIGAGTEVEL